MKLKEAIDVLEQTCSNFQGNLQQHQLIQAALSMVKSELPNPAQFSSASKKKTK